MLFFVRLWYRITMAWTLWRLPTAPIDKATRISEIPSRILYGDTYRRDPRWCDYMAHPRCFQARINLAQSTFDCEDHAGYWAAVLHKSRLSHSLGIGIAYWEDIDGAMHGHAVCLYTDAADLRYLADYGHPVPVDPEKPWWSFGHWILGRYAGVKLTKVVYLEISGYTKNDTPIFRGKHLIRRRDF